MDPQRCGELFALAKDLVCLFREHELEKARDRVHLAQREYAARSYDERSEVIHQVNQAVFKLRTIRDEVQKAISGLSESEQLFAEAQIKPILDEVFNSEIAALLDVKRRHAKP